MLNQPLQILTNLQQKCDAARPHCGTCVKLVLPPSLPGGVRFSCFYRQWQSLISVPAPPGYA